MWTYSRGIAKQPISNIITRLSYWYTGTSTVRAEKISTFAERSVSTPSGDQRLRIESVYGCAILTSDINRDIVSRIELRGDDMRRLYYDYSKIRSILPYPTILTADSSSATLTQTAKSDPGYSGQTPTLPTNPLIIIGESVRTDSSRRACATRWDNATGYLVFDPARSAGCANINAYGACSSVVMELYCEVINYPTATYTSPGKSSFRTIPATLDASGKLYVSLATIYQYALTYYSQNNLASQFFTGSRTTWPTRSQTESIIAIYANVTPIVTFPETDISEIGWTWTP